MTSTSPTDDRICRTCGNTESWHRDNDPHHPFVDKNSDQPDGLGPRKKKDKDQDGGKARSEAVVRQGFPSDPVLRVALVRKGILSMADIEAAELELREAAERGGGVVLYKRSGGDSSQPIAPE